MAQNGTEVFQGLMRVEDGSGVFHLIFEALGQPLFHHGLVVEVAGSRNAFNAGEHARIEAEGDRGGLTDVCFVNRADHEFGIEFMVLPEGVFRGGVVEVGKVVPRGEGVHGVSGFRCSYDRRSGVRHRSFRERR